MNRQYIFKLTPNNKNVIINTSVLSAGKYADVSYPINIQDDNKIKYTIDKETFKFVDSNIYTESTKPYPVSMEIIPTIQDIPFYAINNSIGNDAIKFYVPDVNIDNNAFILCQENKKDGEYVKYNIRLNINWSDDSIHTLDKNGLSYTVTIKKKETAENTFPDFELFKAENSGFNFSEETVSAKYENGKYKPTVNLLTSFRDSLDTDRRHVADLFLDVTYTDNNTGRYVHGNITCPLYQLPHSGEKVIYYNTSIRDLRQPLEIWSPTITYTYVHKDEANPKVDIDASNIISTIHIHGSFIPDISSYNLHDLYLNSSTGNIYGSYDSSIDVLSGKNLAKPISVYILPYYFDPKNEVFIPGNHTDDTSFNDRLSTINNFNKEVFNNKYIGTIINFKTELSISDKIIENKNTSIFVNDSSYYAIYAKYYVENQKYYQVFNSKDRAFDPALNYDCSYYKKPLETLGYDSSADLALYKVVTQDENGNDIPLQQYMYCVNDINCQVPVYAVYPVYSTYVSKSSYAYDFTQPISAQYIDASANVDMIDISVCTIIDDIVIRNTSITKPVEIDKGIQLYGSIANTALHYLEIDARNNEEISKYITINGSSTLLDSNTTQQHYISANTDISPNIYSISLSDVPDISTNYILPVIFNGDQTNKNKSQLIITNDEGEKRLHNFKQEGKDINNNLESFMLLRANPKLSGNIKLVVDSDYNLYIDTFKSSDLLNNSQYRKYPVSAEGNYPRDVKQVFKSLPISELYKTTKNSLNAHKIYTDYQDQFETMYEYGAETNTDVLYSENMRILAPLHIGKNIPEFFAIFRYDGVFNEETYNNEGFVDINKFKSLITDSDLITTIDLRQYTSIGQYLNNYKNMIQNFGYGQCGLQFIEQDNYKNSESYRQGKNIWKGILVNQGILAEQSETSYFANKILSDSSLQNKQELFNNYIQAGFERHGLLYPNIINVEFMFNDNDKDEYTMHRYFGLYLYENDFINYNYITDIQKGNNKILQKYNNAGTLYTEDGKTFKNIFIDKYKDRIFYAISNDAATRVFNETDVNNFLTDNIKNKPEYNISNVHADNLRFNDNQKSFMTMHFKKAMQYGEHLKFIIMNVVNQNSAYTSNDRNTTNILYHHYVYEIIGSNDERLRYAENNVNPYVTTHVNEYSNAVIYKRISFYTQDVLYPEVTASISEQIKRIIACIDKFKEDNAFTVSYHDNTTLSVISSYYNTYLQHIAAPDLDSFKYDYLHIAEIQNDKLHICTTNKEYTDSISYLTDNISYNIDIDQLLHNDEYNYLNISEDIMNNTRYYSYVETSDPANIKTDNISYYNSDVTYYMKPMSNVSEYYDMYYIPFANFDFETLGWRHNTVVKFIDTTELKHTYVLYDDITAAIKNIDTPLVFTANNTYETIRKFNISSGHLTNNIVNPVMYDKYSEYTQQFDFTDTKCVVISNPFNGKYNIVQSQTNILLANNMVRLYKPKSASIAVMGISNIKDIDVNINADIPVHRETKLFAKINANETVLTDESDSRIQQAVMYELIEGTLRIGGMDGYKLTQGERFIVVGEYIYSSCFSPQLSDSIFAATDVTIKLVDKQKYQEYDYTTYLPTIKPEHFFTDISDIYTSDLMYPVVPQINCAWKSTGLYIDDNNVIDTGNLSKEYIQKVGHFTESVFTTDLFEPNQYVINKIDNVLYVDGKQTTYRECILNKKLSHAIKKLLINDVNITTAVCHYNFDTYSLEFIYYGIKFVIKFNDKIVNTYLHLDAYNNYNVFILNEYDSSRTNELFISMHDEFILLVNHQFYIDYAHEADNNIKDITSFIGYAPYSTYKSPISADFSTLSDFNNMMNGMLNHNAGDIFKHIDIHNLWSSWFIQEGYDNFIYSPLENIMTRDNYVSFVNYNDSYYAKLSGNPGTKLAYIMTKADGDYNTQIVQLISNISDNSSISVTDIANANSFNILTELNGSDKILTSESTNELQAFANHILRNESIKEKMQRYIESISDNIDIYVIPENDSYKYIQNTSVYNPLMFTLTVPNYIKYNYGYFTPNVNNMVSYAIDDLELGTIIDVDLLCANTVISNVEKLINYTGNKVFATSNNKVLLNYFTVPERSLFSSTWDTGYYRLYKSENQYDPYDGQLTGIDDKSFFGSRCMVIKHPYIELDTWVYDTANDLYATSIVDSEFNTDSGNVKCFQIDINISNVLYHYFINNKNFVSNWEAFKNSQHTGMKNYINYTMVSFYNFNSDVELTIQKVDTDANHPINIIETNDISNNYSIYENFKSSIRFVNNEYVMSIIINQTTGMDIHPVIKIYRK